MDPERLGELRQLIHSRMAELGIQDQIRSCIAEGGDSLLSSGDESGLLRALEEKGVVNAVMKSLNLPPRPAHPQSSTPAGPKSRNIAAGGPENSHTCTQRRHDDEFSPYAERHQHALQWHQLGRKEERPSTCMPDCEPKPSSLFLEVLGGRAFVDHLVDPDLPTGGMRGPPRPPLSTFTLHVLFQGQRFRSRPVPCSCEPQFREGFLFDLHTRCSHSRGGGRGGGGGEGGGGRGGGGGGEGEGGRGGACSVTATDALSVSHKIHLVLIHAGFHGNGDSNNNNNMELVGSHQLEWRRVLSSPGARTGVFSVELSGVGPAAKIPCGVLDLRLELQPRPTSSNTLLLDSVVVSAQLNLERERLAERERLFLLYARQWWKEYLQVRPAHSNRLVKIFAQDESGRSRLVSDYVRPLRAGRLLDGGPRQAARFISLIPHEQSWSPQVGSVGSQAEVWSTRHALLSRKKGGCEDHAVLLCGLLLGFGLDAYVCIGSKIKGGGGGGGGGRGQGGTQAHAWVVTLGHSGAVTFWESLTAQRFLHTEYDPNLHPGGNPPPRPLHPYRTLGCMFNHRSFLANSQPSDSVLTCSFDVQNPSLWKALSPDAVASVVPAARSSKKGEENFGPSLLYYSDREHGNYLCLYAAADGMGDMALSLLPSRLDGSLLACDLEVELRELVAQHRADFGLGTLWDDQLSYMLSPALAAYELERATGVCVGNEEFQDAVHKYVPEGQTFKGFPIQVTGHCDARRAYAICLKSPVCTDLLETQGDEVRMALRVRVNCYPEDICAVWIMFAVKYRSVL